MIISNASTTPDATLAGLTREEDLRLYAQLTMFASAVALNELSSAIAHELNQPLGAIATYAQAGKRLLARLQVRGTAAEVLNEIDSQARAAGELIHRIRARFAMPPAHRLRCRPEQMVNELRPVLESLVSQYEVVLQIQSQSSSKAIFVDPLQIQYVLLVLVRNASQAATGAATSIVRITIDGDANGTRISVRDSGLGVPSGGARDQLFHPLFTTKQNGMGLGLPSSKSIVESHGGKIGYEEIDDGGARFWFSLPSTE